MTSSAAIAAFFKATGTLPQNVNWATNINSATPLLIDVPPSKDKTRKAERSTLLRNVKQSVVLVLVTK
jgi:hypothetical protein